MRASLNRLARFLRPGADGSQANSMAPARRITVGWVILAGIRFFCFVSITSIVITSIPTNEFGHALLDGSTRLITYEPLERRCIGKGFYHVARLHADIVADRLFAEFALDDLDEVH